MKEPYKTAWENAKQAGNKALTAVGNGLSKTSDFLNTAPGIGVVMGLAMFAETGGQDETPALAEAAESLEGTAQEGGVTLMRFGEASEQTLERFTTEPYAIVLSCSDSRVPPEISFDQRVGDLFVVRVAGNVASDEAIGSIEYAIEHLKTPKIIVVLGHERCGAVEAALSLQPAHDLVPSILNRIFPAISGIEPSTPAESRLTE